MENAINKNESLHEKNTNLGVSKNRGIPKWMVYNGNTLIFGNTHICVWKVVLSLKLTFSHLKMDGWNTILSFGDGLFSGAGKLLVSGRVCVFFMKRFILVG